MITAAGIGESKQVGFAAGIGESKQVGFAAAEAALPPRKSNVLVPKRPVEKDALVKLHFRRIMELATCSCERDAAMLATVSVLLACVSSVVAPAVYEFRLR